MGASCICMPGATMERRSTLLEGSQVLKGETVGAYEVWRGLPAARVSDDVEADRQLVLEQKSVDWDTAHVAGVLGIGPAEAVRLLEAAERNEPRAKRVMDQLARLRGRLGSRRKFRKPLAPLERRPPHLRPPKLAQALDVSLEEARAIIRDWRRSDPEAEAQVSQARLLLLTAFADLPDIENARRVFQAAAAGETEAADLVRAYRHSSKSNFVNRTRSGSSRADRHFGSKKPGGNFGGQLDPTIPRHKQPGMYHERGILPPPPRHFYRDVTLVLSGALVVSVAINVHFLFFS